MLRLAQSEDIAPLADLWFRGWRLGHLDIAPPELAALRTKLSFENRIRESLSQCYVSGPVGAPRTFIRIIGTELDQFYIDPDLVGSGLGKRLMLAAESLMKEQGVFHPHLICAEGNDTAAGFYKSMGWTCGEPIQEDVETTDGPYTVRVFRFEKTL